MLRSLRSKITFNSQLSTAFVSGIFVLAITSSLAISWVVISTTREYFVEQGIQLTRQFSTQSKLALLFGSKENAEHPVETMLAFPDVLMVAIFDWDRTLLLNAGDSTEKINPDWLAKAEKTPRLAAESSAAWFFVSKVVGSTDPDWVDSPFGDVQRHEVTLGYVIVTLGKGSLQGLMKQVVLVNTLIALTLALILMLVLRVITKKLTTPLEKLSDIMMRADKGETAIRAELDGPLELQVMEQAFNKMMSVIEEYQGELKAARDAALETAQEKAEFAAVVSHEIRTPLNGVLGMLNLLNEIGVPERQQQYLNVAVQSGDALLDLINDILDFSKIDAGKLELESIDFDLRTLLEDVLTLFVEKAQTKEIDLCLSIPSDLPVIVNGDPGRLRQVMSNLLGNAVKFTEQGEIVFSVTFERDDNNAYRFTFAVNDTGVGIPRDAQRSIFDSFSQADNSTTRKFGGTGLGLAICKQLINMLGGFLDVESETGVGSEFFFTISLKVIEDYTPDLLANDTTCLILDDSEPNRRYLADTLSSFGCSCMVAKQEDELFQIDNNEKRQNFPFDFLFFNPNACRKQIKQFVDRIRSQKEEIARCLVIMITPNVMRLRYEGIAITLGLPVRYQDLRRCLQHQSIEDRRGMTPTVPDYAHASKRFGSRLQVLVVDDNRTNQLVAKAMLKESGILADVASSGRESVDQVTKKHYELVLMDCNMPDMDGFEATRRIRALRGEPGKTPIFAMTATDNADDLKRCLDVGMDDYLIKPLTLDVLRQKLDKLLGIGGPPSESISESEQQEAIDSVNFANLEHAMGKKVAEIVEAFLADTPDYIADIKRALDAGEQSKVVDLAHNLKGSSRNLGANFFASICRELEDLCRDGLATAARANKQFSDLELEFQRVESALKRKLAVLNLSSPEAGAQDGEIVLVVDDDRSTRLTIVNALKLDGLFMEQAVNGREGLEKFQAINPDLVIMDAVMPVMNGFDASREIKRTTEGKKTPILMITALENDESIERAFKCGVADFIPKPINLAVLRRRVKRVLDARQSEQRVERLAYIDGLTGLPNRIAFSDRLMQDIAYARRNRKQLAVLFVDIDHFKDVNDNLGHAAGDELLKVLAERVGRSVRGEDTLARLGGDEFVVVLGSVSGPKGVDIAAKNLLKALSTPFKVAGREIYIGASIGISIYPDDGKDRETLLKNADTAMYRAKALGRNNYQFYTLEMSASISDRVELETDLRKVQLNQELALYYQPKADSETGRIMGAEALIRWQHPKRGFLLPDSFIPIADEIGMLSDIGGWVLNTACLQCQRWLAKKQFDVGIAVNVSARQLMAASFIDNIKHSLELTGLNPKYLELEITENTVLEHGNETIEKLKQLSAMGVRIALDDFGVGYSSFSYLKRLPVNVVKLDRSFVKDVPEDTSGAAIIDGMIKLAHNLHLEVVAEGVESKSQYEFLRDHGCDVLQGHYIGKAVPQERFFAWYVENMTERKVK